MEQLENFIEYTRFLDKAQRLMEDARDRIQIIDLKLSESKEKKDHINSAKYGKTKNFASKCDNNNLPSSGCNLNGYVLRKSASCDSTSTAKYSYSSNAEEYDEIDQIYDYVRGFAPLPKNLNLNKFEPIPESTYNQIRSNDKKSITSQHIDSNGNYYKTADITNSAENIKSPHFHHHHHHHHIQSAPIPPPVQTIPKNKPEKRQRPNLPKLYVKNNIIGNNVNTAPAHSSGKETEPHSPLFHIR
jgi:hypothetical protein